MAAQKTGSDLIRVAIVGVGLIGGSIGLALRRSGLCVHVKGIDRSVDTLHQAIELGAIDEADAELQSGVAGADIVFVATPISAIEGVLKKLFPLVAPGTLVTDVASSKEGVCRFAESIRPPSVTFVGGHPMAGSERVGVMAADRYLFQNAAYVLTPLPSAPPDSLSLLERLVLAMGARIIRLDPKEHDLMVAAVSHLPHVVAAALVNGAASVAEVTQLFGLAGGGFRDTTRIASGDPRLWREICLSNKAAILATLDAFWQALGEFRTAIETADAPALEAALLRATEHRKRLPQAPKGILSPVFDLLVHIADRPGALHEVTGILSRRQMNIIDIEILRVREGEGGTLRLALESEDALATSIALLKEHGYTARARGS